MEGFISKREENKAKKREIFLTVAEELFAQKGFENTSIEDLVQKANLTKRTLYQYFLSKEDLFYAVALKGAQKLYDASIEAIERGKDTRDKIRLANLAHLEFYQRHIDLFRILNYTPANLENSNASPHYQAIKRLDGARMMTVAELMTTGVADGSIKPELDMKMAVLFGFFSAFSLLYTFAFTDKSIWKALQLEEKDFLLFSFDLISNAMK